MFLWGPASLKRLFSWVGHLVRLLANRLASHIIRQQTLVAWRDRQDMIVQHLDLAHPGHFNPWRRW
eukprot:7556580-Heterocapsa_arctica.AAC.1